MEGLISKLAAYMQSLGLSVDVEGDFNSRLELQRMAFIVGNLTEDKEILDLNFSLYLNGPYSTQLADLYYKEKDTFSKESIHKLSSRESEALEKLKRLGSLSPERLEALATVLFLLKKENVDWLVMVDAIKEAKPKLSLEQIVTAINDAKVLLITVEEVESFKKEMISENEFWDKLSALTLVKTEEENKNN
ncbi:MAG: hypothetical protein QW134_05865 [Nitrososphaeria archaeon]